MIRISRTVFINPRCKRKNLFSKARRYSLQRAPENSNEPSEGLLKQFQEVEKLNSDEKPCKSFSRCFHNQIENSAISAIETYYNPQKIRAFARFSYLNLFSLGCGYELESRTSSIT